MSRFKKVSFIFQLIISNHSKERKTSVYLKSTIITMHMKSRLGKESIKSTNVDMHILMATLFCCYKNISVNIKQSD